ncbi:MAG: energy-coupling factor transporter transmembrane protein EcfT [Thermofilaceae archaeon]|nr:energy-coupling factor transporter transmembrane protein EcfT [Thermofilaceae archaeon]MCX8179993.1 energy-coupling factor transporter transmembrane protein EcfT [Thermofilaceae archaeon]MDW8004701.1 energy-coupling factor transporter transmembrane component T [Thermofilaceae archaeon]
MSKSKVKTFLAYLDSSNPLLRLHPFVKVLALLVFNLVAWLVEAPYPLLAYLLALVFLYPFLRVSMRNLIRALPYLLLVAQAVTLGYLVGSKIPGSVVYFSLPWGTYVSDRTLMFMASVMLRISCMVLGSTLVFISLRDVDLVYGFKSVGLPFAAAFTVNLSMRFSMLFMEDYARIRDAMVLKGAHLDSGGLVERARLTSLMGVPLMVLALKRMQDLSYVLELRGFPPKGKRTYVYEFVWRPVDAIAAAILLILLFSTVALRLTGFLSFPGWPFL